MNDMKQDTEMTAERQTPFEPGPYELDTDTTGNLYVYTRDGDPVAKMMDAHFGMDAQANGALLSAAPDLYAALVALKEQVQKDLLPICQEHGGEVWAPDMLRIAFVWEQVDAALSKARGEVTR